MVKSNELISNLFRIINLSSNASCGSFLGTKMSNELGNEKSNWGVGTELRGGWGGV
jgi:hypothetical protein